MKILMTIFFSLNLARFQTDAAPASNKNLAFLFAGYAVVWLLIVGYLFSLSRRQKKLAQEMEMLKQMQKGR